MKRMQEKDFDNIEATCSPDKCTHPNVVKLYYLGMHSDYGCVDCKVRSGIKEDFEKHIVLKE